MLNFTLALLTCSALYIWVRRRSKNRPPFPPGPPGDPLIGHIRLVPPDNQELLFYQWGKTYGDVMHLRFLHRDVIVLNSVKAAVELLDKRSIIYSDRPWFPIFEMMGWIATITFIGYGKRFQRHRRMIHPYLTTNKCEGYKLIQAREARVLLKNLLADEGRRDDLLRLYATSVILQVAYGQQVSSNDDPFVKITLDAGYAIANGGPPASTPVDFFPFLRFMPSWFPGCHYANFARDNKFAIDALMNYPYEKVTQQMAEGKVTHSFLSSQLEALYRDKENHPNTLDEIKGAAGVMFLAGSDTTWATLSIFFLAMVLHPEYQRRAQAEIDAVVGTDRLPDFSDRKSLPFVECIYQESLRWNSAVPLGVAHRVLEDDVYEGMFIPKGALIIPNARAMTLDENIYTNPSEFNPTRYLPKPDGNNEPYPNGLFGFGRRICPGRHLAGNSLWIVVASVLATFDVKKVINNDGKEDIPVIAFSSGVTSHPHPFKTHMGPRGEQAKKLILQDIVEDMY
ncbi:cytochrome P450 [Collybia nuda]|uniref:Cytochrome P450 n=1 Tax=Collybia nuda TaxID=64659 RepID=A0A9P6CBI0_9AGAR|nr:cytochrome P450 [Collybia nuda]